MKGLKYWFYAFLSFLLLTGCAPPGSTVVAVSADSNPEITAGEIISHIKYLASDDLKGRWPGTPGSRAAMEYIIANFNSDGILPAGDDGSYKQHFDFVSAVNLGSDNDLSVDGKNYQLGADFTPLGFSATGSVEAEVVFAGYGFSIHDSVEWNDYSDVDASERWVLILMGGPDVDSPHSPFDAHLPLRKKVLVAEDNGAVGVLAVSRIDGGLDKFKPLRPDYSAVGAGIPVVQLSQAVASAMLSAVGQDLLSLRNKLDEKRKPQSIRLGVKVRASVDLEKEHRRIANVVGLIPGSDPILKDEYVVIGSHFDHLGLGGPQTNSRAPSTPAIHNGADDNASGTAGVVEIGEKLAAHKDKLKRSILLICFNAEEEGTLGSRYFVDHSTVGLSQISVMLNMDMVGRLEDNKLVVGGMGTSPDFETILTEINRAHGLTLKMSTEGFGPSDHASFYRNDIPVLFFFTGTHEDYHKPSDDWEKINAPGEKRVLDFIYDVALYFSQREQRPVFAAARSNEPRQPARGFKVTFGVIPSYASSEEGLEIDGTRPGGPADRAGMEKGDVIIEISGKKVRNIYDYMYRLGDLKAGQTVEVKVKRGNNILTMTLQL